jgi:hypothetical protein
LLLHGDQSVGQEDSWVRLGLVTGRQPVLHKLAFLVSDPQKRQFLLLF